MVKSYSTCFQLKHLEEKDKKEEKERLELKKKAEKELKDWYTQHSDQVRSTCACMLQFN